MMKINSKPTWRSIYRAENIFYVILLLIAIYLATSKYGLSNTFQTIAVLFCVIQTVRNIIVIYSIIINKWKNKSLPYDSIDYFIQLVIWVTIIIVYFGILTAYFQKLVLYLVFFVILLLLFVNFLKKMSNR